MGRRHARSIVLAATTAVVALGAHPATARGGDAAPVRPTLEPAAAAAAGPTRFHGGVYRLGPFLRVRVTERNWHEGCPVPVDDLRHVEVAYRDFRGRVRSGPLIVHERLADDVLWVFRRIFRADFRIHRIKLPPAYRPPQPQDYWRSTRNRTAAFNCRPATGNPGSLSHHSFGWAIDVNPLQNPYVGVDGSVLRRAALPYVDRTRRAPGMIHPGDVVVRSFAAIGWEWGGDWTTIKDYMHFSLTGR